MNDLIERLRSLGKTHDDMSIGEEAADEIARLPRIGAVLIFEKISSGQVIGADGRSERGIVIYGEPDVAEQWARDHLRKLEASGMKLGKIMFVSGNEQSSGCPITTARPKEYEPTKGN